MYRAYGVAIISTSLVFSMGGCGGTEPDASVGVFVSSDAGADCVDDNGNVGTMLDGVCCSGCWAGSTCRSTPDWSACGARGSLCSPCKGGEYCLPDGLCGYPEIDSGTAHCYKDSTCGACMIETRFEAWGVGDAIVLCSDCMADMCEGMAIECATYGAPCTAADGAEGVCAGCCTGSAAHLRCKPFAPH